MGRRDGARGGPTDARAERPDGSGDATNTPEWAQKLRTTIRCAGVLLVLLLLLDWSSGRLTPWRAALWLVLAGLLFFVLYPARVSAGGNWLASRRLLREHRVRTDLLVSIRYLDGISQRVLLRDVLGGRVEIDPEVLIRNPLLWLHLDHGARKAAADGHLLCGATVLGDISRRVDRETARAVFKASGLE